MVSELQEPSKGEIYARYKVNMYQRKDLLPRPFSPFIHSFKTTEMS